MYHAQVIVVQDPETKKYVSIDPFRNITGRGESVEEAKRGYLRMLNTYSCSITEIGGDLSDITELFEGGKFGGFSEMPLDRLEERAKSCSRPTVHLQLEGTRRLSQMDGPYTDSLKALLAQLGQGYDLEIKFYVEQALN